MEEEAGRWRPALVMEAGEGGGLLVEGRRAESQQAVGD